MATMRITRTVEVTYDVEINPDWPPCMIDAMVEREQGLEKWEVIDWVYDEPEGATTEVFSKVEVLV